MSARLVIRHNGETYAFLRVEQHNDGSIYLTIPRASWRHGGVLWEPERQRFVPARLPEPAPENQLPRRISYHTTGRVNYGDYLADLGPVFYEPLYEVTQRNVFFLWSIPRIERLDRTQLPPPEDGVLHAFIDVNDDVADQRNTFYTVVAPLDDDGAGLGEALRLGYPTFALFIVHGRLPIAVREGMENHFIYGAMSAGIFPNQRVGRLEAELAYHHNRAGQELVIYPPDARGVYTLYPSVVMRIVPRLHFEFSEPGLQAEVVEGSRPNKIRFRVRGPGGYITDQDLRPFITNGWLDAEL